MVKKGIKQFLAGMCAVLVMPTGTVQECACKRVGTGIAGIRGKVDQSRIEIMVYFAG